jgi:hypothetical protein
MYSEKWLKKLEIFRLKQEEKKRKLKLKKLKEKRKKKKIEKKQIAIENEKPKKIIIKKRKVGRPKKRGPKKKRIRRKIIKIVKPRPVIDFKIVSCLNGKQNGYIGSFRTYNEAWDKLKELECLNESVEFPRRFLNSGTIKTIKDEYLMLERNRYGDKEDTSLRNEFGKFVKHHISNNDKWIIREKTQRLVEETFWVYGFDPKTDRKTSRWIYENLLLGRITSKYDIIRILLYKNKLIIRYDNEPITMIMCKNKSDAIRLYNHLSDKIRTEKIKQIICIGAFNIICDARREIEKQIMELTGWNKMKIQRSTN